MYFCSSCKYEMSAPLERCPGCGVVLTGVKCGACGYSDTKSVFVRNNDRCPKCGSAVHGCGLPKRRLPYVFMAIAAFALGWLTSGIGTSTGAGPVRAVLSTQAFGLGIVFACALIVPRVAGGGFLAGSIVGAFLAWPIGAIVLNSMLGVEEPVVYRVTTAIVMLVIGWIVHVVKRVEEGTESSVTTLSLRR